MTHLKYYKLRREPDLSYVSSRGQEQTEMHQETMRMI